MSAFHHEALLYAGDDEYLAGVLAYIGNAVDAGGSVLVAVGATKTRLLREALGDRADHVRFADIERLGRNPACIIPAWREFVSVAGPGPLVGVGEPVWPGRSEAELVECRRHESLLNLAFDGPCQWRLLCPYDTEALNPAVLEDARHNHPHVIENGVRRHSERFVQPQAILAGDSELPPPSGHPAMLAFTGRDLALVRAFVSASARNAGFGLERLTDLVLAVDELVTNSLRHGGGRGIVRTWEEDGTFLCEVHDGGRIDDPLAGERAPELRAGGRGLWLVNHLCDLVQVRSSHTGNVVRVHMSRGA